jgi:cystathionine gamma-lyase
VFAAPYHLDPVKGPSKDLDGYGRTGNPTLRALELAIGDLEGGECLVFGSGMAAITAVLLAVARPGGAVAVPADGYFVARQFAETTLAALDVAVTLLPTAGPYPGSFKGLDLLLLESPANPWLDLCDIPAVAAVARGSGALVAVDNTTATPLGQRPLDLGADLSVASASKALTGHSDLVLGYVCGRDPTLMARMRQWRDVTGAVPGPFEAWLAHRSIATLDLRLARQSSNAAAAVAVLTSHSAVAAVRWPFSPDDPCEQLARRQLRRPPGVVTFLLADKAAADRFLTASQLISAATSFGGVHTSADRRAQWGDAVPEGLIRLSCGVEDPADLVADLRLALDAAAST